MNDERSPRKAESMVQLVNEVYPVHTPKVEPPATKPKPPKSLDRVKGERRTAHSEREFADIDFTVPANKRVNAPEASRTRGFA